MHSRSAYVVVMAVMLAGCANALVGTPTQQLCDQACVHASRGEMSAAMEAIGKIPDLRDAKWCRDFRVERCRGDEPNSI